MGRKETHKWYGRNRKHTKTNAKVRHGQRQRGRARVRKINRRNPRWPEKKFARTILYNKLKLNNAITSIYILCWFSLFLVCSAPSPSILSLEHSLFSVRFFPLHILFFEAPSQCNFNWLFFMRKRRESILVFHFAETIDFFLLVAFSFFFVLFPLILSILHIFSKLPVIVSKQLSYTWEEREREKKSPSFACELFLCSSISWRDLVDLSFEIHVNKYGSNWQLNIN